MTEKKRVRRDPDEARALILDAAERVFGAKGPDAAGLKDVAKAAGVSHALVSHYFGSYEALVEETLARRVHRIREDVLRTIVAGAIDEAPGAVLERVAALAEDRVAIRLMGWAFLSGRAQRADFFSARDRGLARVVDAIEARRRAAKEPPAAREELELAVVATLTMVLGFGLAKDALVSGLGHAPGSPRAKEFADRYRDYVRAIVAGHLTSMSHKSARR